MKRIVFFVLLLSVFTFSSFAEIVSWKGEEIGTDEIPAWLESYLEDNNLKPLRKKFDIGKRETVIIGIGESDSLEGARQISQIDAQAKLEEISRKKGLENQRLKFVFEYWYEDDETGFKVFSLYTL